MQQLCYEVDVEPYAKSRDAAVGQLAAAAGVAVSASVSHTLYVSGCEGDVYLWLDHFATWVRRASCWCCSPCVLPDFNQEGSWMLAGCRCLQATCCFLARQSMRCFLVCGRNLS